MIQICCILLSSVGVHTSFGSQQGCKLASFASFFIELYDSIGSFQTIHKPESPTISLSVFEEVGETAIFLSR